MKSELALISEPLPVNELPLREKDFIECQRALFGKRSAFLYTVVAVCCMAALGVYAIAKQMGVDNSLHIGIMIVLLLCLLIASVFYFAFPKWLGKLRYRQYETSNSKLKSVAFYTDHFEIMVDGVKVGVYSYLQCGASSSRKTCSLWYFPIWCTLRFAALASRTSFGMRLNTKLLFR